MRKLFLFIALTLCAGLWAANSVITFTSTKKLCAIPDAQDLELNFLMCEGFSNCEELGYWKNQHPEFQDLTLESFSQLKPTVFDSNAFLDANDQVLTFTIDYDESTHAGTITFAGELVKIADDAFYECAALTSITLPEGVTSIGGYVFYECTALTSVILPESLSSIGDYGFLSCPLSSVTIPANVTYLGMGAFGENSSLADVYVAWTTTLPTVVDIFRDSPISTATLHVPVGSLELYKIANVWKDFGTFVEHVPLPNIKTDAIAAVNAKIAESDNDNVKAIATSAATAINAATTEAEIYALKDLAIANITSAKAAYTDGKEAGKAEAKAALPTDPEGTTGHTVTITKGDKTLILVNPDKVTYGKQE